MPQQADADGAGPLTPSRPESSSSLPAQSASLGSDDTRRTRIRRILEHRRLLLQRLRQGRAAASKRLEQSRTEHPESKDVSDEQELADFRDMVREATALARKVSKMDADGSTGEKRTSVSLRKGSSVGKRMNAALSSLVPGAATAAAAASAALPQSSHVTSSPNRTSSSAAPGRTLPTQASSTATAQPSSASGPGSRPPIPKPPKTAAGRTMLPSGTQPQHGGISGPTLPPNRLAHQQQQHPSPPVPSVVCPEAELLRKRRNEIRHKLIHLANTRRDKVANVSSSVTGGTSTKASSLPSLSRSERIAAVQGPGRPVKLPRRRQTHWDYLLEEMRWLATDFREERKWKTATARLVGDAVATRDDPVQGKTPLVQISPLTAAGPGLGTSTGISIDAIDQATSSRGNGASEKRTRFLEMISAEEETSARQVASIVSNMVAELCTATVEFAGNTGFNALAKALRRHQITRSRLEGRATVETVQAMQMNQGGSDSETALVLDGTTNTGVETDVNQLAVESKAEEFQRMSKAVDELLNNVRQLPETKAKASSTKLKGLDLELTVAQGKMGDDIEAKWKLDAGSVLRGPLASGKTITTCSLLWRHRRSGPQLVVCSSAKLVRAADDFFCGCNYTMDLTTFFSMKIRWLHELGSFQGIKRRTVGFDSGISRSVADLDDSIAFENGDVVLCDFGSVSQLKMHRNSKFSTVVIDCRFPCSFLGSRSPTHGNDQRAVPTELRCARWWDELVACHSDAAINRMSIENSAVRFHKDLEGLPERQILEIMALRLAFLYGPKLFRSSQFSMSKTILAWGRKRIKETEATGSKYQRVTQLFEGLVEALINFATETVLEAVGIQQTNGEFWEVHASEMSISQRDAYVEACNEYRALLSSTLETRSTAGLKDIASAFLHLRRQCIHRNMPFALKQAVRAYSGTKYQSETTKEMSTDVVTRICSTVNASQPNFEIASEMMQDSGKLKVLFSILRSKAAIDLDDSVSQQLQNRFGQESITFSDTNGRPDDLSTRIVLLAALPDVRLLISMLLSAIGIGHDLLFHPNSSSGDAFSSSSEQEDRSIAWMKMQLLLSKFNDLDSLDDTMIVITSPETAAGDHGGLGVDQADLVICLDQDWSGRGELVLKALLARSKTRKEALEEDKCEFVVLVAADTCEDRFMSFSTDINRNKSKTATIENCAWGSNAFGIFSSSKFDPFRKDASLSSQCQANGLFTFPALNLFSKAGERFYNVFAMRSRSPCLLSSDSHNHFLPTGNKNDCVHKMNLMQQLLKCEEKSVNTGVSLLTTSQKTRKFATRQDFPVLSTRMYLERIVTLAFAKTMRNDLQGVIGIPAPSLSGTNSFMEIDFDDVAPKDKSIETCLRSFLTYTPTKTKSNDFCKGVEREQARSNAYSSVFASTSHNLWSGEGKQGMEPLVYFPPIFPRMRECMIRASADIEAGRKGRIKNAVPLTRKRSIDEVEQNENKRTRIEDVAIESALNTIDENKRSSAIRVPSSVVTEDEASSSDAVSVLIDLTDDYGLAGIGAVPLPRDSAVFAAHASVDANGSGGRQNFPDEWLAGSVPFGLSENELSRFSAQSGPGMDTMILVVSRKRPRGYSAMPSSMNAFTGNSLHINATVSWMGSKALTSSTASHAVGSNGIHDLNGEKKLKKKASGTKEGSVGPSAFSRPRTLDAVQPLRASSQSQQGGPVPKTKDVYRARLLSSTRKSGLGTTLFEAATFRAAAVRIRNKVCDRLARHVWQSSAAFEAGPGLPLIISKQHAVPSSPGYRGLFSVDPSLWTSLVKRLKSHGSSTGDEAVEMSLFQRTALRRSLVAPCRVDFGPFQVGFLSSTSGMTIVAPPRPRPGVVLPMGVKIMQPSRELDLPWTAVDDENLQAYTVRFGMNWTLTARCLSGFQDSVIFSKQATGNRRIPRAARSCRDRWQSLARTSPSLAREVRQSERSQREHSASKLKDIVDLRETGVRLTKVDGRVVSQHESETMQSLQSNTHRPLVFLTPVSWAPDAAHLDKMQIDQDENRQDVAIATATTDPVTKTESTVSTPESSARPVRQRRSFSALLAARAKKKVIPLTLPGVTPGIPPAVVPSHQSHMQAVQASIAASWSSNRADMWPLQILEATDRQHGSTSARPRAMASHNHARPVAKAAVASSNNTTGSSRPTAPVALPLPQQRIAPPPAGQPLSAVKVESAAQKSPPRSGGPAPASQPSYTPAPQPSTALPTPQAVQHQVPHRTPKQLPSPQQQPKPLSSCAKAEKSSQPIP
jgi:hypothetical protein